MMGFWNITAKDLREGDEVRVTVMGGEEYLTVDEIDDADPAFVRVRLAWGFHVPRGPFWDSMEPDKPLTVRR